jgi:hypothetical protein
MSTWVGTGRDLQKPRNANFIGAEYNRRFKIKLHYALILLYYCKYQKNNQLV